MLLPINILFKLNAMRGLYIMYGKYRYRPFGAKRTWGGALVLYQNPNFKNKI